MTSIHARVTQAGGFPAVITSSNLAYRTVLGFIAVVFVFRFWIAPGAPLVADLALGALVSAVGVVMSYILGGNRF